MVVWEISGSLTGSQQPQAPGYARPCPATALKPKWHVRPCLASSGTVTGVPPKQQIAAVETQKAGLGTRNPAGGRICRPKRRRRAL
jgi:hypothetical protein